MKATLHKLLQIKPGKVKLLECLYRQYIQINTADQHWKQSCLVGASPASGPRVQSISSKSLKTLFQPVHGTDDFIFYRYKENIHW